MKRVVAALLIIILTVCFCVSANAQSVVNVELDCEKVETNRLFDIAVFAKSDELLCGGEYEITFDSKIVEYRDVNSELFEVQAKCKGDRITVIFASANGIDIKENVKLFTLQFKCISQGDFDISLKSIDCINNDFETLGVKCSEYKVSVEKALVKITSKASKDKIKSKSEKSQTTEPQSDKTATADFIALENNNSTKKAILYGACAGLSVVLIFVLGVVFGKSFMQKTVKKSEADHTNKVD